jgi:hypothetical protein
MLQSFLSSVIVRLQGRFVHTHSYYYREGGKRPSPCAANSRYEIEGDEMVVICSARLARRPVGPSPLHAARVAETALLAAAGCGETLFPLDEGWL